MATFKGVVLNNQRKQDGTYNVKIRVTHNRQTRYIATPFYVTKDQLTRGMKIKDNLILDKVQEKIVELRRASDELGFLSQEMSVEHLVKVITSRPGNVDFISYMEEYANQLGKERGNRTKEAYLVAARSLRRFTEGKHLYFPNITKRVMADYWDFIGHLRPNTRASYIFHIKSAYRRAQKEFNNEDAGLIMVKHGVFDLIELPRQESLNNMAFETVEQMQAVIDAPYYGTWVYDFTKDLFILSFVLLGTNLADLVNLRKGDYQDGILTYRRKKVSRRLGQDAEIKIQVPEVARIIFEKYSGDPKYLLDFRGHSRTPYMGRYIHATFQAAGIEPKSDSYLDRAGHRKGKYIFYSARHSMATFARNVCHIDKETVHEMLNHASTSSMHNTDVYLRKDYTHLWEANEKLMALFDWGFYLRQADPSDPSCLASEHSMRPTQNQ